MTTIDTPGRHNDRNRNRRRSRSRRLAEARDIAEAIANDEPQRVRANLSKALVTRLRIECSRSWGVAREMQRLREEVFALRVALAAEIAYRHHHSCVGCTRCELAFDQIMAFSASAAYAHVLPHLRRLPVGATIDPNRDDHDA